MRYLVTYEKVLRWSVTEEGNKPSEALAKADQQLQFLQPWDWMQPADVRMVSVKEIPDALPKG